MMSCTAFTALGVYIAATNKGNAWVVGGSAVFALIFLVIASYRTWRDEHDRYIGEITKNQKPDIRGEAFNFSGYGIFGEGQTCGHWSVDCQTTFELFLCNQRPINTTLKDIHLDGSKLVPPVIFRLSEDPPASFELPHGIGKTIKVKADATVDGSRIADVPPIIMDDLRVQVEDAFGQEHPIQIRNGERLIFGGR